MLYEYKGMCYENATGLHKDMAEAARYYQLAADQGLDTAQCNYGNRENGHVHLQFFESCFISIYILYNNLGLCCDRGTGVTKNVALAVRYFKLAADQGLATAQFCMGNYLCLLYLRYL